MRKFQAALCGLLILCVQMFMPTAALAAAGDVATTYSTETRTQCTFVALTAVSATAFCDVGKTTPNNHTVMLVVTGGPASCTANLQGFVDGVTAGDLSGNQTCTSSVMFHVGSRPVNSIKINLSALSGGTAPTVTAFYLGIK